jgi:hypothetical protein
VASGLSPEELARCDADDGEGTPLHLEHAPDDVRLTGEPLLPVAMADDGHGFAILFGQRTPENGVDAEHRVVVARHQLCHRQLGFAVHADMRVQCRTERREPRQHVAAFSQVRGGSGREREDVPGRTVLAQHDQAAWVADGKRPQEHSVRQGEDRRVRADAERQHQHCDRRKHRIPPQGTKPVVQVARQIGEPGYAALIAKRLHRLRHTPGPDNRSPRSLLAGAAAPPLVFGGQFQVQPEFRLEFGIPTARPQGSPQTRHPLAERGHWTSPAG